MLLMPASLIPGFQNELRGPCADHKYISESDSELLKTLEPTSAKYRDIISESNDRIAEHFQILSYNAFLSESKPKAPIVIVDEIQNIDSASGSTFNKLLQFIEDNPKMSVALMSGTPIFDSSKEILSLMRLLRITYDHDKHTPDNRSHRAMSSTRSSSTRSSSTTASSAPLVEMIPRLFDGKVSYYAGAPQFTFPTLHIHITVCRMSQFQSKWFVSEVESEMKGEKLVSHLARNDFYVKSRQRSNIVYPRGLIGDSGVKELPKSIILRSGDTYSAKFTKLVKRLNKRNLAFVYLSFTNEFGIVGLTKYLRAHGYVDYMKKGPGLRRYVIWSGDQTLKEKTLIRAVYNSPKNDDASQIQIVIGSSAIKEGVSLLRTKEAHIVDEYWNHSRHEQIFGRVNRFCSHSRLPSKERYVDIYFYAAVTDRSSITKYDFDWAKLNSDDVDEETILNSLPDVDPRESIDLYIMNIATRKLIENKPYVDALMHIAVDKRLYNRT